VNLRVIDTHQHLWDPSRFSYSWMNALPTIRGRRLIEEYRAARQGLDVLASVYIDTDVDDRDLAGEAKMIFALADVPTNQIGGIVASVRPEQERFLDHLEPFLLHPKLKGVRRVLHTQPDELSHQPLFIDHVRSLAERNLSFDICVLARQLPRALELVRACPRVSFILDHSGNPAIRQRQIEPWRQDMIALAQEPNVVCKISGLVNGADPARLSADLLRPFVEHVLECFGWDRVVWGSDWPVCTLACPLARWIEITRELLVTATRDQRERLLWRNALQAYRLEGNVSPSTS